MSISPFGEVQNETTRMRGHFKNFHVSLKDFVYLNCFTFLLQTIESFNCKYLIKAKAYPTLVREVTDSQKHFVEGEEGKETFELETKLNTWDKERRFVVSRVLKP